MDSIFSNLAHETLLTVEDWLTNLGDVSDWDLFKDFTDLGLSAEEANAALALRVKYLIKIYKPGHSPLFKGDSTISFNPHKKQFEKDA